MSTSPITSTPTTTRARAVLDQGIARLAPVEIGDGAWLGENVVVGPGVRSAVARSSARTAVVLGDVPAHSLCGRRARAGRAPLRARARAAPREAASSSSLLLPADRRRRRPAPVRQFARYLPRARLPAGRSSPAPGTADGAGRPGRDLARRAGSLGSTYVAPGARSRGDRGLAGRASSAGWASRRLCRAGGSTSRCAAGARPAGRISCTRRCRPFESAEAAARLARDLGRPWVADLRDPWALDEMMVYPTRSPPPAASSRACGAALGTAAAIVMNTPEAAARRSASAFPELGRHARRRDPERLRRRRLRRAAVAPRTRRTSSGSSTPATCTPSSACASAARLRRGGSSAAPSTGVDFLTRSHVFLLEALDAAHRRAAGARRADRAPSRGRPLRRRPARSPTLRSSRAPRLPPARGDGRAHAHGRPPLPADARPPGRDARRHRAREDLRVPRLGQADPGRAFPTATPATSSSRPAEPACAARTTPLGWPRRSLPSWPASTGERRLTRPIPRSSRATSTGAWHAGSPRCSTSCWSAREAPGKRPERRWERRQT